MSKKLSSHFETAMMTIVFVFSSVDAHAAQRCETLFRPGLTRSVIGSIQKLNPFKARFDVTFDNRQLAELSELLKSPQHNRPYGIGRGGENPLFVYKWTTLSEMQKDAVRSLLDHAPQNPEKLRDYLTKTLQHNQLPEIRGNSFLDLLVSNWFDVIRYNPIKNFKFSDWMRSIEDGFEAQVRDGRVRPAELKSQLEHGDRIQRAQKYWTAEFGVKQLTVTQFAGEPFVQLGNQKLKIKINESSGTAILTVPRELVRHAAWNPLSSATLQGQISSGVRPPAKYPGFIGADGLFYLSDGNHRFELDTKKEVQIEMSYPVKTSSMSITFDALGISQPMPEKLIELHEQRMSLDQLIGPAMARRIVYR